MIKIGMTINDRYEIIEKIGTGGMSDVYKALDNKLNRNVAVKVLKQEFGDNENFVSKFRVEAQAAAGLMHPNIVNVYDVGEENDIHYIVMELVEGITLKKYIEKKARLTYKEAVSIAIQVSLGIEAAHGNRIIHRDIKPQNIIISRDGKVKVTDFGIAKAATSNTITSNVMGSVHYTSPEQARGGYSDEKSDIYSLGISMFEMLTGRVPFNGETTVAIAIKHIQEQMPSPREYVPEIPQCVESIIYKCTEKSPDRRYQNMQEVIKDLKQALLTPEVDFVDRESADRMGGTRVVSDEDMTKIKNSRLGTDTSVGNDTDRIMQLAPAVGSVTKAKTVVEEPTYEPENNPEQYTEEAYSGDPQYEGTENEYQNEYSNEYYEENYEGGYENDNYQEGGYEGDNYQEGGYSEEGYYNEGYEEEPEYNNGKNKPSRKVGSGLEDEDDYNPKVEKITTIVAIAAGIIIVILIVVLLLSIINGCFGKMDVPSSNSGSNTGSDVVLPAPDDSGNANNTNTSTEPEVKKVTVPKLVGEKVDDIRNKLYGLGLNTTVLYEKSDTVEEGYVISASANEGDVLDAGSSIELKVSGGKSGVKLPDVTGKTYETAFNELSKAGFKVTKREDYSNTVEEGYVISQDPAAADSIPVGSQVVLVVSKGKQSVKVPNLLGLTEEEAVASLVEAGLKVGNVTTVYDESFKKDLVCKQNINSGSYVLEGTAIDFVISLGKEEYKFETKNIAAITNDECPQYKSGTGVKGSITVVVKDAEGTEVFARDFDSLPPSDSTTYYGVKTPTGTITISFKTDIEKKIDDLDKPMTDGEGAPILDENGNQKYEQKTVKEEETVSFTRNVTFEQN